MMETKNLKGAACEEITNDTFKKLNSAGKGQTKHTAERFQGGDGSKRTLRQG